MNYLKLSFFAIIFSFAGFAQESNIVLKSQIDEIETHIKEIDLNSYKYVEEYDRKPIKNIQLEERSWEAYYLKEKENQPLRIIYNEFSPKTIIGIKIYYQNEKKIFGEYFEKSKKSKKTIVKIKFYFDNSGLIYKTNSKISKFDLEELLNEEKVIRSGFQKK
nr:hypothetical protein [uncultured Flavobacterium sp.]